MIVGAIAKAMENSQWMKRMILGKRRDFEIDNDKARQGKARQGKARQGKARQGWTWMPSSCSSLSLTGLKGFREKLSIGQSLVLIASGYIKVVSKLALDALSQTVRPSLIFVMYLYCPIFEEAV